MLSETSDIPPIGDDLVAIILALSNERDRWERRCIDAERTGYALGYSDAMARRQRADDQLWAALPPRPFPGNDMTIEQLNQLRWALRGQPRTRETFGAPHPADR